MQQSNLCFDKVKKDCLKFIKSQETKADKFKNKEKMIKSFLIPLCFWISKKADKKRPYFTIRFLTRKKGLLPVSWLGKSLFNESLKKLDEVIFGGKMEYNLMCFY